MKHFRLEITVFLAIILLASVLTIVSQGVRAGQPQMDRKIHALHVRKMRGHWKVAHAEDSTKTQVSVKRGESVSWMAVGSDVVFQFPDSTLFGTYSVSAKAGKTLSLEVSPDAKSGRYVYSIFCVQDVEFATADSPPVIIVQ